MITIPYKILMVEDDYEYYLLAQEMMSSAKTEEYRMDRVDTLERAKAYLSGTPVDIVLLDLQLPDGEGGATFNALKNHIPQIPIVVLTGTDDEDLAVSLVRRGAEDYLVKAKLNGDLLTRVLHYAVIRKRMSEELRAREERYSLVIERTGQAVYDGELRTGAVTWLGAIERITGYSPAEIKDINLSRWWDLVHAEDRSMVQAAHRGEVQSGASYHLEYRLCRKDGNIIYVADNGVCQMEDGCAVRLLGTLQEITERKKDEIDLKQHSDFLAQIIESMAPPLCVIDIRTHEVVLANSAAQRGKFWRGVPCYSLTHDSQLPCVGEHVCPLEEVKRTKKPVVTEHFHRNADGEPRHMEIHAYPVFNAYRDVVYMIEYSLDITEKQEVEKRLKAERDRAQMYLDVAGVMMVVIDTQQRVVMINKEGCEVLGFSENEVVGRNWFDLVVPEEHKERERRFFNEMLTGALPSESHENVVHTKSGEQKIVAWKNVLLRDAAGTSIGALSSGEDITERRKMHDALLEAYGQLEEQEKKLRVLLEIHSIANDDLREAKQQLLSRQQELMEQKAVEEKLRKAAEEAMRAKSQFLANMSHEVRTPLNSVIGFMNLLRKTELTEKQRRYAENVFVSGNYLLTIVNDILEYEKVFSGQMFLEWTELNLRQLLRELVDVIRSEHEKKAVVVDYTVGDGVPELLWGDPVRLRQVVHNLLANAFKFTESGRISVAVEKDKDSVDDVDTVALKFVVEDTGVGIPPESINKIFDAFTQADNSITRKYGGTGLGLTICAAYVKLMSGRIWVESELGKGSRFIFVVRLRKAHAPQTVATPQQATVSQDLDFRGIRLLVAEGREEVRKNIQALAGTLGLELQFVSDGKDALEKIREGRFDICLLEIKLPYQSGIDVARDVRRDISEKFPLIVLTEADFMKNRDTCRSVGMTDFLSLPVNIDQLKERLREYVISPRSNSASPF